MKTTTQPTNRRRASLVAAVAIALALPLTLAACSSSDSGEETTKASDGLGAQWGACVRDAGFEIDDPSDDLVRSGTVVAPEGVDQQAYEQAANACSEKLGVQALDTAQSDEFARQYEQVAQCIRDNGYEDFDGYDAENGAIDLSSYARAGEPGFEETTQKCLAEFSPDTQTMQR